MKAPTTFRALIRWLQHPERSWLLAMPLDEFADGTATGGVFRQLSELLGVETLGDMLGSPLFTRIIADTTTPGAERELVADLVAVAEEFDFDETESFMRAKFWSPGELYRGVDVPRPPRTAKALREWAAGFDIGHRLDEPVPELSCWAGVPPRLFERVGAPTFTELIVKRKTPERVSRLLWGPTGDRVRTAALKQIYLEALRVALRRKRARMWSRPLRGESLQQLSQRLRALLEAIRSEPGATDPVMLDEVELGLDPDERSVFMVHDRFGVTVTLPLAHYREYPLALSWGKGKRVRDRHVAHARSLVEWTLDALHDPRHGLHDAVFELAGGMGWCRSLDALERLVSETTGPVTDEGRRVTWRVNVHDYRLRVEPAVQKRSKKTGDWTPGKLCEPRRLQMGLEATLSREDREVVDALAMYHDLRWGGMDARNRSLLEVARALARHPHVVRKDNTSRSFRVREVMPALVASADDEGVVHLELKLGPIALGPTASKTLESVIAVDDHAAGACLFCERTSLIHGLLGFLAEHDKGLPPAAHVSLVPLLQRLQPDVDLELDGLLQGRRVEVGVPLTVRLRPDEDEALDAEIAAVPFAAREGEPDNATWPPGGGPETVFGEQDGERVHARRELDAERREAERVVAELDLVAHAGRRPFHFRIEGLEPALELVSALQEKTADGGSLSDVRVEWAPGKHWRVAKRRASVSDLRVKIERGTNWFAVDGSVEVDGESIELEALLEASRAGRRFVRVGPGQFVEIERTLAKRIAEADSALVPVRGGLGVGAAAVGAIAALADESKELEIDEAAERLLQRLKTAKKIRPRVPKAFRGTLRGYQREGFVWLMKLATWGAGACLADEMGLGKTIQALAVLIARASLGPAMVVAPTSVCANWMSECRAFAPSLRPRLYHGPDRERLLDPALGPGDLVITSYDIILRDVDRFEGVEFTSLVLDEAQAIKNSRTRRAKAIRKVAADWRLALSGTPIENHLGELWSLFDAISPALLGSWDQFRGRFAGPIERTGCQRSLDGLRRLLGPFILRRRKADVAKELPPRTEVVRPVDLSREERVLYEARRREAVEMLASSGTGDMRFVILAAITRLRQLACDARLVDEGTSVPTSKIDSFMELVEELTAGGHRALVFSQFTGLLALARERLDEAKVDYLYLDGQTPARRRAGLVARWQSDEATTPLFLISLKAGGTGLNLTAADYVLHLDPWWNPAVEDQASDRAHRIGQTKPVTVVRFVSQGTIEQAVIELHGQKRELAEGLLASDGKATRLSPDELMDLIRSDGGLAPLPADARAEGARRRKKKSHKALTDQGRKRARAPARAPGPVNTRTVNGRADYDRRVLDALRQLGVRSPATEIASKAGGSALQLRASLARLEERGLVVTSGRARGTRYALRE